MGKREDAVVLEKYPHAVNIYPLIRLKKLNRAEWILDFLTVPGIFQIADAFSDRTSYYLVELEKKQLFVHVTKDFIIFTELAKKMTGNQFVINQNKFKKAAYQLRV